MGGTLLIARRGTYKPCDVRNQTIEEYVDAGGVATDGLKFVTKLRNALLKGAAESRSPVHLFLPGLFVAKFDRGESPDEIIQRLEGQLTDVRAQLDAERDDARRRELRDRIRTAATAQRLVALASEVRSGVKWPADIYESLATGLRRFDRVRLASDILREGLMAHPESAPLLREQGFCARVLGHTDEARRSFEQALALTPHDTHYRSVLVLTDQTLAAGTPDHWTRFARGEAFVAQNDPGAALDELAQALGYDPPPGDIRSEVEQLQALRDAGWRTDAVQAAIEALTRGLPASSDIESS